MTKINDLDTQVFSDGNRRWRITRLIKLAEELKPFKIPMKHFNFANLKPNIHTMQHFVENVRAVNDADLSFPIILDEEGFVMDGRHRVAKAILTGEKYILAVRFKETPPCCYTVED